MVKVVVTGISIFSCLGNTEATWHGVINHQSGIKFQQPFSFFPPLPLALIDSNPSFVGDITYQLIDDLIRRSNLILPLKQTGVVIGSSRGCQADWEKFFNSSVSGWLDTLPCQPSRVTAQYIQSQAVVYSPMNACATGLSAIAQGYELIKQKRCQQVIVGAVETPITPLTIAGFMQMKALTMTKCDPFGKKRDGFVLGEGGAMLILESEEFALRRQAKIYGEIVAWGMSCDAQGLTAPEKEGYTAINTIQKCLQRAQILPQEIDYIHAHGTATILNDRREAKIINTLFPHQPKVSSTKSITGHTLGASGAIATALTLLSLHNKILIPNYNFSEFDFDLNFVTQPVSYPLKKALCFSFGFGGQNVIIALKTPENT